MSPQSAEYIRPAIHTIKHVFTPRYISSERLDFHTVYVLIAELVTL